MSKYSLLEIVQQIASSIGSDEITSIADSTESNQIANIVRRAYFDLIKRLDIPEHFSLVKLTETSANTPVVMTLPSTAASVSWIKYNKKLTSTDQERWTLVDPLPVDMFFEKMHSLDTDETYIGSSTLSVTDGVVDIYYRNDKQPDFYTVIDDSTIVFDSYDISLETYLTSTNSLVYTKKVIPFTMSDGFTPSLDEEHFALLLNEATSLAWAELKQTQHPIAERNSRRGWTHLQRTRNAIPLQSDFNKLPNFGRK
jgi:hypothetical protein